ncbi:restriction endonuclease subunit S [Candidatus Nitrotoga sp. M5]|uniref:restriction endonuclease subunit S n=1 Tax=Candidatus Nitrotoga sp. M5 TaxID=2890409 RepID=UPI001EF38363|nr:restriction endonuclease subunit S [Candidatus Nitrotoga sp. M5]CAH1385163.1 putative Type I site-specific deoxyribonuclease [Candidatus Nitrotoga sp. M5]
MSILPNGWANAPLKSLLSSDGIFSDGDWIESKDQDPNGSIRLLQLADIGDGYFVDKSSRFVNEEKFAALHCTELKTGDVLIARMPDPLGRACLLPEMPQSCITVVDVAVFRTGEKGASNKWLMNAINSPQLRAFMETNSSGTTRKRISRGKLTDMELPIPPLNEQKRIADKLDAVLARVDACRDRLDRIPSILKRIRQSVLAAATSGKLTEDWRSLKGLGKEVQSVLLREDEIIVPESWNIFTLREVIDPDRPLCYGVVQPGEERNGGVPLIRVQDMDRGGVLTSELRTVSQDIDAEYKRSRVVGGDLLVSVVGTIGRTAIVPHGLEANIARAIARVACRTGVSSKWVNFWLSSEALQWWLTSSSKEVARKTLNLSDIALANVAIPSVEEQTEIVRRVEALFAFADRLEARHQATCDKVEKLTPATLAKAFRGELVQQDPNDEPASVLLKRIATERAMKKISPKNGERKKKETYPMKPKNVIPIIEALRAAKNPLTSQALLVEAGYPTDAGTELVERFFLDIRAELEGKRIERVRKGNDDFFSIVQ